MNKLIEEAGWMRAEVKNRSRMKSGEKIYEKT